MLSLPVHQRDTSIQNYHSVSKRTAKTKRTSKSYSRPANNGPGVNGKNYSNQSYSDTNT